jgi:probable phosphoglycerate mutase
MKLYFVRHGETDVNSGLQQAHTAQFDEPLNITGIAQAEQLAEELKNVTFDAIVSSPLQRTMQTAKIINKFHNLDVKIDDVWRELKTNNYLDATSWHNAFDFDNNEIIEGIEPIRDFFERIYMALDNLKATYGKDESVLVVSSGGVHQAVYAYVNSLNLNGNMRLSPMKNCEYREYEVV